MEKSTIAAKKQCLNFAEVVGAFMLATIRDYDFPLHRLRCCWGRRDIVLLYYSRELYRWEKKMENGKGTEEQGKETKLTDFWRRSSLLDEIVGRWSRFCEKRYGITTKKVCFFPRFLHQDKEYGYILCMFCHPFFAVACTVKAEEGVADCGKYAVVHPSSLVTQNTWTEETMNVELCRMLRETGGKGPERCRVLILDDRHILFILSGFIVEGFRSVTEMEAAMVSSLQFIIKRQLGTCVQNLLGKMGVQSVRCDIEMELESNEASILVVL
ncbi:MAG TPA: hypothetical protein VN631_14700 [Negativicutes bacterium]|nr:hypothetical protein [Negativicutes bacterium]